jgi:putative DNA primase/helicase
MIGGKNEYNPAADWIDSRPWDGVDRIVALCDTLDPLDHDLAHTLLRRWMIGAAGCVYEPNGMAMQGVLVLQGPQYSGKTTWFWSLTNRNREIAKEGASLNPSDRDSVKQAVSYWLVELGEIDATFKKTDIAALKAFITKDRDELRLPYAPAETKYPRRTAFAGTVNPKQYLHDDTGNRRFWTIPHGANLRGMHDIDMQQAWAQAKALWASGERHPLTRDEMERLNAANSEHEETSPIEELISTRFRWEGRSAVRTKMTATDVLIAIGFDKPNNKQCKEVGTILRGRLGEPKKSNGRVVFDMPQLASSTWDRDPI